MAFYGGEREGGWNVLRACGLCVQGIAAQKCIHLYPALVWMEGELSRVWAALPALSLSPPLLLSLAVPAWLGALQRARWPRLSSPRCVPWALWRAAGTRVTACVGASARPWEPCVPGWKQGIFSLESLGGGGKAVAGSGEGRAVL